MKSKYIAPIVFALLLGAVVYASIFWYTRHKEVVRNQQSAANTPTTCGEPAWTEDQIRAQMYGFEPNNSFDNVQGPSSVVEGGNPPITVKFQRSADKKTVTTSIHNESESCMLVSVGLYKMYDRTLVNQKFYNSTDNIVVNGFSTATVTNFLPDCMTQIDLYGTGQAPRKLEEAFGNNTAGPPFMGVAFHLNQNSGFQTAAGPFCVDIVPPPPAPLPPPPVTPPPPVAPTPPPPPQLVCVPANQSAGVNQNVTVSATGGTGQYAWQSPGGNPTTGAETSFTTKYATAGSKTITVTSGSASAVCHITITQVAPPPPPAVPPPAPTPPPPAPVPPPAPLPPPALPPPPPQLVCAPAMQYASLGQQTNFTATGGTGTYSWSAPEGNPLNGTSNKFTTSYATAGTKTVTVSSGNQTAVCKVEVTVTLPLLADLALTKTVDKPEVKIGDQVIFTVVARNEGTTNTTGVTVEDILPKGLTFVSAEPAGAYNEVTGIWQIGALNVGESQTLKLHAKTTKVGTFVNTAEIASCNLPDIDSVPLNRVVGEDDLGSAQVKVKDILVPAGAPTWPYPVAGLLFAAVALLLRFRFAYGKVHIQKSGKVTVKSRDTYE